jgi:hypothetical protein
MFQIPDEYKPFVKSVKRKCKYHKINFMLCPAKWVIFTEDFKEECSGYFDDKYKSLVVSCGKPVSDWMPVFIHESSHLDQWVHDKRWKSWEQMCIDFWEYMAGNKMLNKAQVNKLVDVMIELELDCEIRSVEKIKKWALPLNIAEYIKKANIYVYSYRIMVDYKKFPTGVYYDPKVLDAAPDKFQKDYSVVPEQLKKELHRWFLEK